MTRIPAIVAIVLGLTTAASAAPVDCTAFLTGEWIGAGKFSMFGSETELDNAYAYNADGTFETLNRYKSGGGDWQEQALTGTWSATPGEDEGSCTLELTSTFESGGVTGSSSSSSTVTYIDENTFRSMDFDMHRK